MTGNETLMVEEYLEVGRLTRDLEKQRCVPTSSQEALGWISHDVIIVGNRSFWAAKAATISCRDGHWSGCCDLVWHSFVRKGRRSQAISLEKRDWESQSS